MLDFYNSFLKTPLNFVFKHSDKEHFLFVTKLYVCSLIHINLSYCMNLYNIVQGFFHLT